MLIIARALTKATFTFDITVIGSQPVAGHGRNVVVRNLGRKSVMCSKRVVVCFGRRLMQGGMRH